MTFLTDDRVRHAHVYVSYAMRSKGIPRPFIWKNTQKFTKKILMTSKVFFMALNTLLSEVPLIVDGICGTTFFENCVCNWKLCDRLSRSSFMISVKNTCCRTSFVSLNTTCWFIWKRRSIVCVPYGSYTVCNKKVLDKQEKKIICSFGQQTHIGYLYYLSFSNDSGFALCIHLNISIRHIVWVPRLIVIDHSLNYFEKRTVEYYQFVYLSPYLSMFFQGSSTINLYTHVF